MKVELHPEGIVVASVLIIGGSGGLGREIARHYVEPGDEVTAPRGATAIWP
jgi:NAD(P)-dependent dehydrogenase (short-subunit alcohol dehydrogenase family)